MFGYVTEIYIHITPELDSSSNKFNMKMQQNF